MDQIILYLHRKVKFDMVGIQSDRVSNQKVQEVDLRLAKTYKNMQRVLMSLNLWIGFITKTEVSTISNLMYINIYIKTKSFLELVKWRGPSNATVPANSRNNSKSTLTFAQLPLQQQVWVELTKAEALWLLQHTSTSCINYICLSVNVVSKDLRRWLGNSTKINNMFPQKTERMQEQTGVGVESLKSRRHVFIFCSCSSFKFLHLSATELGITGSLC